MHYPENEYEEAGKALFLALKRAIRSGANLRDIKICIIKAAKAVMKEEQ